MSQRNAVNSLPPINTNDLAFEPGPLSAVLAALCATPSGFLTTPKLPDTPLDLCNLHSGDLSDADVDCAPSQHRQPTLTSQQQETVGDMKEPGNLSMADDNHGAAAAPERVNISNVQQDEAQDKDMLGAQLQQKPSHAMQLSRKLLSAEHEAGNAQPDVSHPSDSNKRQRMDPMVKLAMQAEVDVLRQQNQALLQRLTSAMGAGVLVHEENATLRRVLSAVTTTTLAPARREVTLAAPCGLTIEQEAPALAAQATLAAAAAAASGGEGGYAPSHWPAGNRQQQQQQQQPQLLMQAQQQSFAHHLLQQKQGQHGNLQASAGYADLPSSSAYSAEAAGNATVSISQGYTVSYACEAATGAGSITGQHGSAGFLTPVCQQGFVADQHSVLQQVTYQQQMAWQQQQQQHKGVSQLVGQYQGHPMIQQEQQQQQQQQQQHVKRPQRKQLVL